MVYLCDRNQKCSTNGHLSNTAPLSCGVPQGSNLGPLLFLVYINDLPNCLTSASPRIFADDTNVTFAASTLIDLENAVNLELRNLQRWLITNGLHALSNNQIDIAGSMGNRSKESKKLNRWTCLLTNTFHGQNM